MGKIAKKVLISNKSSTEKAYQKLRRINGQHPWQKLVPEGCILYPARRLNYGQVTYFNFNLAKEMGLLSEEHLKKMNKTLHESIIHTFSLRIINEYDVEKKINYPQKDLTKNLYMSTRYLQPQHKSKSGKTSGDGRSIWNGIVNNRGVTWDVSSRGTGVTKLSPGAVESGKNLRSGNTKYGYGCGLAELDELYGSAILSEVLHNSGLNTERTLAIIDLGKGLGIGVRAGKNLFRPAHIFMYSKQNCYEPLKKSVDFLINRQIRNKAWDFAEASPKKYDHMLNYICEHFSTFSAKLEREYIFAWMAWDGDNVLATGGLIDYGSVRMFGLRHDQYRFDDDDRMSTTLTEQKKEARLIVKTFAQVLDYVKSKKKKSLKKFDNHPILKKFDELLSNKLHTEFLRQMGFNKNEQQYLIKKMRPTVKAMYKKVYYLERLKTYKKQTKVADGINRPPILNTRSLFRFLTKTATINDDSSISFSQFTAEEVQSFIASKAATKRDLKMNRIRRNRLRDIQLHYCRLIQYLHNKSLLKFNLSEMRENAFLINRRDRLTGNATILIVDEIIKGKKSSLEAKDIQTLIDNLVAKQSPQKIREISKEEFLSKNRNTHIKKISENLLSIVEKYAEEI